MVRAAHTCTPPSLDACAALTCHQTSASFTGPPLFATPTLQMCLTPSVPRLGVALVPLGTNRRLFQCQWHSWLVPFSMLDLASLERMWPGEHTEAVKWGAGVSLHLAFFLLSWSKRSHKNTFKTTDETTRLCYNQCILCLLQMRVKNGFDTFRQLHNEPFVQQVFFMSQMSHFGLTETNELLLPASRLLSFILWQINP